VHVARRKYTMSKAVFADYTHGGGEGNSSCAKPNDGSLTNNIVCSERKLTPVRERTDAVPPKSSSFGTIAFFACSTTLAVHYLLGETI